MYGTIAEKIWEYFRWIFFLFYTFSLLCTLALVVGYGRDTLQKKRRMSTIAIFARMYFMYTGWVSWPLDTLHYTKMSYRFSKLRLFLCFSIFLLIPSFTTLLTNVAFVESIKTYHIDEPRPLIILAMNRKFESQEGTVSRKNCKACLAARHECITLTK